MSIKTEFKIVIVICLIYILSIYMISKPLPILPKGELVETISSPNSIYQIHKYVTYGNATSTDFIRYEVENIATKKKRNIYYGSNKQQELEWISDYVIQIYEYHFDEEIILDLDVRIDYYDESVE